MRRELGMIGVLACLVAGCAGDLSPHVPIDDAFAQDLAPGETPDDHADGHEHAHDAPAPHRERDQPLSQADGGAPVPTNGKVEFLQPRDGELVLGPLVDGKVVVEVVMGAEGLLVEPAGVLGAAHSGHHHVLIDRGALAVGEPVVFDAQHLHLGKGQAVLEVALTPGHHTLTSQFADGHHRSFGPALADTIEIVVAAQQ